jgi:hypothetical protein
MRVFESIKTALSLFGDVVALTVFAGMAFLIKLTRIRGDRDA